MKPHKEDCQCASCKAKRGEYKGVNNPFYQHHHSEETCKKIGDVRRGRCPSPEHRKKIGDANRNPSSELRKKIGDAVRGEKNHNFGKHSSRETRKKQRTARIKLWRNPKYLRKHQEIMWALWRNPEYIAKQRAAKKVKQNKAEVHLQKILDDISPGQWQFVGDFKLSVGGKFPDFVHTSKPLLIELFGEHWHSPEEVGPRTRLFNEHGYQLLVIWDYELKNVVDKISSFLKSI